MAGREPRVGGWLDFVAIVLELVVLDVCQCLGFDLGLGFVELGILRLLMVGVCLLIFGSSGPAEFRPRYVLVLVRE